MDMPEPQPSQITAADLAGARTRLGEGFVDDGFVYWLQSGPAQMGRTTLMRRSSTGVITDITPDMDIRGSIHDYGGGAAVVDQGRICFFDARTGVAWTMDRGGASRPITSAGPWQFGGFAFLDDDHVVCLRQDNSEGLSEPVDALVRLNLRRLNADGGQIIASGADFYSSPVVSKGGWIAWTQWDHPAMAWMASRVIILTPEGHRHVVADRTDVSAVYPQWEDDGCLLYLSDETGWWSFHRWDNGQTTRLHDHSFDFCSPPWVLSQPPYAVVGTGDDLTIGCSWWRDGMAHVGVITPDGELRQFGAFASASVLPCHNKRSVIGYSTPVAPYTLALLDWETGVMTDLVSETDPQLIPAVTSRPRLVSWPTQDGMDQVTGWHYPPTSLATDPPPLLVLAHGGPTGYSDCSFSLVHEYFTSRGIALLDVNYSGSSARGRAWRTRLDGQWGVGDVADCVAGADHMVDLGLADPDRLGIMGSSAGGFTVLSALTTTTVFSAGISWYGIADLTKMRDDPAKFEKYYTDHLVSDFAANPGLWADRSPVNHIDALSCPILLLQGENDPIVRADQSEAMYRAAREQGLEAELVIYPGEGHGFRQPSTLQDAYTRVLAFLDRVWGLSLSAPPEDRRTEPDAGRAVRDR